ncbi:InlB B-repeat-containing protein [Treponema medium]|uniref:InlB B-repeat-containing protein n=1 Tax=Treponema medium TaxID=58231 RepID=UPI0023EA69C5|nr:InlB B-repeat-containing protein [Treponema medium]
MSNQSPTLHTVTFDAQGGSTVTPIKVEHGKTVTKPADPAKGSFGFGGWYKESTCTTPWNFATDTVTADITLFAKWTPVAPATVTVTFAAKGGHGTLKAKAGDTELSSGASVKKGTEITFTADPEAGYEVDYMLINEEKQSGTSITVKADKDLSVTVKFKAQGAPATEFFTVTYKAEPTVGGAVSAKSTDGTPVTSGKKIEKGTVLVFTAVPNTGYDISSWTGATPESDNKSAKLTVTGDSSVTVMFALKKYTVTFDAQGGSTVTPIKVEHGKTVTKPADPAKGSFGFGGWYKESTCTTPWNFATDTVTADITLFAKWKITIQFDASKITCWRNVDDSGLTGTSVADGGTVYENDVLILIALPSAGKRVDSWTINGNSQGDEQGNFYRYMVKESPSELRFDYTEKAAKKVELQFDTSKIRCTKLFDQTPIMPGQRDEGDRLIFRTVTSSTVQWKINGYNMHSALMSFLAITLVKDFGNGNVLKIDYE